MNPNGMRRRYPYPIVYVDESQYSRKRQRRQAAAIVVQSLWGANNNMGRKSTAQPRPAVHVPPRGIGPIAEPNENDVLCGRGGRINSHSGNIQFRDMVQARKKEYLAKTTKKLEKAHIAAKIVTEIRTMDPPGRFLKEDSDTGLWFDIGDAKAIKKAGQALREDAPDIRPEIGDDSSGDEKNDSGEDVKLPAVEPEGESKSTAQDTKREEQKASESNEAVNAEIDSTDFTPIPVPTVSTGSDSATSQNKQQAQTTPRQGFVSGRGPQHMPGRAGPWSQQGNYAATSPQDYQAQAAMPPPYTNQMNAYSQPMSTQMQGVEIRNIPIQAPHPSFFSSMPNQIYSGVRSVGQKATAVSRQAMEVLSQSQPFGQHQPNNLPPEDIAFGRTFHPPAVTVMSSDNTMSTISAMSDPVSSGIGGPGVGGSGFGGSGFGGSGFGGSGFGGSGLGGSGFGPADAFSGGSGVGFGSGVSGMEQGNTHMVSPRSQAKQSIGSVVNQSLRLSQLYSISGSVRGPSISASMMGQSSRMSDLTASMRSTNSLTRSFSLSDMNSITDHASWRAIMEGDEDMLADGLSQSILSTGSSERFSTSSRNSFGRFDSRARTTSTAMSIASMSIGSTGSSAFLAGFGNPQHGGMTDDGRSVLSEMSSDLHALDLAGHRL